MDDSFDVLMGAIRRHRAANDRLNAAGVYYNVWLSVTSRNDHCLRCGSVFAGHRCHIVGSPTEAHRLAQPTPEQGALW
jgi:ribosomal protein S27AE